MRRWTGTSNNWNVSLNLLPLDDDNAQMSRILTQSTNQICQSLVDVLFQVALPLDTGYVWITSTNDITAIHNRILGIDSSATQWLRENRFRLESIFTFVSFGPTPQNGILER